MEIFSENADKMQTKTKNKKAKLLQIKSLAFKIVVPLGLEPRTP